MPLAPLTQAKRRIVDRLKRADGLTAGVLAADLGLTEAAVRQHLDGLEQTGLVTGTAQAPTGPGRPAVRWSLTDVARELFPDRHGDLTVALIDSMRATVGEHGLQRVIDHRTGEQLRAYRDALPPAGATVWARAQALAEQRTAEGYMAEVLDDGGDVLLVENHCPICDAAQACLGLCRSELELFRQALGEDVSVERVEHLLSGGRRCVYRISENA